MKPQAKQALMLFFCILMVAAGAIEFFENKARGVGVAFFGLGITFAFMSHHFGSK
jgi:hypothetical protein